MDDKQRLRNLEKKLELIQAVPQLPATATLAEVIASVNKITNSLKRIR